MRPGSVIVLADRFFEAADTGDGLGCWRWKKALNTYGYGVVTVRGFKTQQAHRIAYELCVGPIPDGLEIDHLCRVRSCVNPSHLEPVTRRENLIRGIGFPGENKRKTHCPQGHEYTPENLLPAHAKVGHRTCRLCHLARALAWKDRLRASRHNAPWKRGE